MACVRDVAQYILEKQGEMTTLKLQKLVYYCQAWALVWTDDPLFPERIEAWANGPVVPDLHLLHQEHFKIDPEYNIGNSDNLTDDNKDVIEHVLDGYGDKNSYWLIDLTHLEDPWKIARGSTPVGVRCNTEITLASMADYYSGL